MSLFTIQTVQKYREAAGNLVLFWISKIIYNKFCCKFPLNVQNQRVLTNLWFSGLWSLILSIFLIEKNQIVILGIL